MAIQIFDEGPTLGGRIGAGFSSGISRGLDDLAKQNLQTMKLKQAQDVKDAQARNLRAQAVELYGTPEQKAAFRSQQVQQPQQSQSTGSEWLDELINVVGGGQAQQQQAQVPLNELLSSGGAGPMVAGAPLTQGPAADALSAIPGQPQQLPQAQRAPGLLDFPVGTPQEEAAKLKQLGKEKIANAKLEFQKQQAAVKKKESDAEIDRKEILARRAAGKDYISEQVKKATAERSRIERFNRLEALQKTGKLTNPLLYSIAKKAGFDIPALLGSPESEAYVKTTQEFMTEMKDIFGARITETMIREFLKSIPTLENTDEGKSLIVDILRLKSKAFLAKFQAMKDLLAENDDVPPWNFDLKVDERAEEIHNKLSADIIERINLSNALAGGDASSLVGKTFSSEAPVKNGATATDENGNDFVRVNDQWVPAAQDGGV